MNLNGRRSRGPTMDAFDESTDAEIEIGSDGRVRIFGASREILEALAAIGVRGSGVAARLRAAAAGGDAAGDRAVEERATG